MLKVFLVRRGRDKVVQKRYILSNDPWKEGKEEETSRDDATGMVRADWRWDMINQENSVQTGGRVVKSDSLSTHLDPKSVVASRGMKEKWKGEWNSIGGIYARKVGLQLWLGVRIRLGEEGLR